MMNLKVPLPEIKHISFNITDDVAFPEGYIEDRVKRDLVESISEMITIEYVDTPNPHLSIVEASLAVMDREDVNVLLTYIDYLQRENESLYKIIELGGEI